MAQRDESEALRREIARLRAENDELRTRFRLVAPEPLIPAERPPPVQVLLLPDPL